MCMCMCERERGEGGEGDKGVTSEKGCAQITMNAKAEHGGRSEGALTAAVGEALFISKSAVRFC